MANDKDQQGQIAKIFLEGYKDNLFGGDQLAQEVQSLIDEAIKEAAKIAKGGGNVDFSKNPTIRKKLEQIIAKLRSRLQSKIEQGSKEAWLRANSTNAVAVAAIAANNQELQKALADGRTDEQGLKALEAFQSRKMQGLKLSDRVWNLTAKMQADIEQGIEVALACGTPAQKLSQEIRHCLQNPDNFFRRFRYKIGEIPMVDDKGQPVIDAATGKQMARPQWGKKWKKRYWDAATQTYKWKDVNLENYRYGTGVYRSSYKNAMRMARTEVNMAYHASDTDRWRASWWVKGIRVSLSNNHTTTDGEGHKVPLIDICDDLAGDYPPDFDFPGWHPQCRCYAYAITATQDEIAEYMRRKKAGEDMSQYRIPGTITEPPANFQRWLEDNAERLEKAAGRGKTPYFVARNAQYCAGTPIAAGTDAAPEPEKKLSIKEAAAIRHAQRTPDQIADIRQRWIKRNAEIRHANRSASQAAEIQQRWDNKRFQDYQDRAWDYFKKEKMRYSDYSQTSLYMALATPPKDHAEALRLFNQLDRWLNRSIKDIQQRWRNRPFATWQKESMAATNIKRSQNDVDLERALGTTKGLPMSYELANSGRENPRHGESYAYGINCQTCTVTHELRRRGFPVEALGSYTDKWHREANGDKIGLAYQKLNKVIGDWHDRFLNPDGSKVVPKEYGPWAVKQGFKTVTQKRLEKWVRAVAKEDGRYEIYCGWKNGEAHVFMLEKQGKKIIFFDPQTGKTGVEYGDKMKMWTVEMTRVDDKIINPEIASLFKAIPYTKKKNR